MSRFTQGTPRWCAMLLCLLPLLSACRPEQPSTLDQQVYIWQRQWRPAHAEALTQSRGEFSALRILALQAHPRAGWTRAQPDLALLRRDGRPLIAVVRLDGQLPQLDRQAIGQRIAELLRDWRAAGIEPVGVEIDHDCATGRLPGYAALLAELRQRLPVGLKLSITALPAWLDSPALEQLLANVDSSVLQVHAVNDPRDGLFQPEQARRWAARYAERSAKSFYLALPAYGVALLDGDDGVPLVESEAPLLHDGARRELQAQPQQVAALLAQLRSEHLQGLAGIVWFRLPLAHDRRAWPLATLLAVARGQPLKAELALGYHQRGAVSELQLSNLGNLNSELPARIELTASQCEAADALGAYRVERTEHGLRFIRRQPGQLAAHEQRALGWARCATIDQGGMHVYF